MRPLFVKQQRILGLLNSQTEEMVSGCKTVMAYNYQEEAKKEYGWKQGKNTLAGKAPGKMIGGDLYFNIPPILPEKEGRIWYECDVDYESGGRNTKRLYYSNDGLMFYSPDHGRTFYYVS